MTLLLYCNKSRKNIIPVLSCTTTSTWPQDILLPAFTTSPPNFLSPSLLGMTGRSCHSIEEVKNSTDVDYCFLSPIYDSISKKGYTSHFSAEILTNACREGIITERVFALGGITPELLPQLQEWGFGGAVMLGYLWKEKSPEKIQSRMSKLTFSSPT